jgi:hypothetical protein
LALGLGDCLVSRAQGVGYIGTVIEGGVGTLGGDDAGAFNFSISRRIEASS